MRRQTQQQKDLQVERFQATMMKKKEAKEAKERKAADDRRRAYFDPRSKKNGGAEGDSGSTAAFDVIAINQACGGKGAGPPRDDECPSDTAEENEEYVVDERPITTLRSNLGSKACEYFAQDGTPKTPTSQEIE